MNADVGRAPVGLPLVWDSTGKDFAGNGCFTLADLVGDLLETVSGFDTNTDCDSIIKSHVL